MNALYRNRNSICKNSLTGYHFNHKVYHMTSIDTSTVFKLVGPYIDNLDNFSINHHIELLHYTLKLEYRTLKILPKSQNLESGYFCTMDNLINIKNIPEDIINRVFVYNLHITGLLVKKNYKMKDFHKLVVKVIKNTFKYYTEKDIKNFYDIEKKQ